MDKIVSLVLYMPITSYSYAHCFPIECLKSANPSIQCNARRKTNLTSQECVLSALLSSRITFSIKFSDSGGIFSYEASGASASETRRRQQDNDTYDCRSRAHSSEVTLSANHISQIHDEDSPPRDVHLDIGHQKSEIAFPERRPLVFNYRDNGPRLKKQNVRDSFRWRAGGKRIKQSLNTWKLPNSLAKGSRNSNENALPYVTEFCRIVICSAIYFQFRCETIEFRLRKIPKRFLGLSRAIFSWTIASFERLRQGDLFEILALKDQPTVAPIDFEDRPLLGTCQEKFWIASADLIVTDAAGFVSMRDLNALDYLTNGITEYRITALDAHEFVAVSCSGYIAQANLESDFRSPSEIRQRVCLYIIEHWLAHVRRVEAGEERKSLAGFVYRVMRDYPDSFRMWAFAFSTIAERELTEEELNIPLVFAAKAGLLGLTRMFLNMGHDPRVSLGGRALAQIASECGYWDVASLIDFACRTYQPLEYPRLYID